jgi:hypothetical protein
MDSEAVRDEREEQLLLTRHYNYLLSHPLYRQSKLIFVPENNYGLEASHLDTMVSHFQEVRTFWDKNKPGVHKDGRVTRNYQFMLSNMLAQDGIKFDESLFTTTREKTPQCQLDLLEDQMYRYHWEHKKAVDVHGKDKYSLTGKVGNKQDDLLITVQMFIYWPPHILKNLEKCQ